MLYPDLYIERKGANHGNRSAPRDEVMPVSSPQKGQLAAFEGFLTLLRIDVFLNPMASII